MVELSKKIVDSKWFQSLIIFVILAAGVIVGLETYSSLMQTPGDLLHLCHVIVALHLVIQAGAQRGIGGGGRDRLP